MADPLSVSVRTPARFDPPVRCDAVLDPLVPVAEVLEAPADVFEVPAVDVLEVFVADLLVAPVVRALPALVADELVFRLVSFPARLVPVLPSALVVSLLLELRRERRLRVLSVDPLAPVLDLLLSVLVELDDRRLLRDPVVPPADRESPVPVEPERPLDERELFDRWRVRLLEPVCEELPVVALSPSSLSRSDFSRSVSH